jgi:hypothetical protein
LGCPGSPVCDRFEGSAIAASRLRDVQLGRSEPVVRR